MKSPSSVHRCRTGAGGVLKKTGRVNLSNLQVQLSAGTTLAHCASLRQCPPTRVDNIFPSVGDQRSWRNGFTQLQ